MAKTSGTKAPAALTPPTSPRQAGHPISGLVGPLLQFDLKAEEDLLRQEEAWRATARNSKTLVKYPDLRIVLILLKSGKRMEGHRTGESISIHVLRGKLRLHLPAQTVELLHGQLLTLERCAPHDVEALEDSSFLLTLSWQRSTA